MNEQVETAARAGSRVVRRTPDGWAHVPVRSYRDAPDGGFAGVTRRLLAAHPDTAFDVRYFELAPGGRSALERHAHAHVVVCLDGTGTVRLGDDVHTVGPGDVVHVASGELHRFTCDGTVPFGFLCIVDRRRGRSADEGEG